MFTLQDEELLSFLTTSKLSASSLEKYIACPYSWLVERGLKINQPSLSLDPRIQGLIAHRAYEMLINAIKNQGLPLKVLQGESWFHALNTYFDQAVQEIVSKELGDYQLSIEEIALLDKLKRNLQQKREREATRYPGYTPYGLEYKISGVYAGQEFTGFIDRIDVKEDLFIIRDYKLGTADCAGFAHSNEQAQKIQAALYAQLFQRQEHMQAAGVFYESFLKPAELGGAYDANLFDHKALGISSQKKQQMAIPAEKIGYDSELYEAPESFQDYLDKVEAFVEGKITELKSGSFPKRKHDKGGYCSIRDICGICPKSYLG